MAGRILSEIGVRHLGIYRTGVTEDQAHMDKSVLKMMYRKFFYHGCAEGTLAPLVRVLKDDPAFQDSLKRLIEWRMLESDPSHWGDAKRLHLTGSGRYWGEEFARDHGFREGV
jgi:hypothetical protein